MMNRDEQERRLKDEFRSLRSAVEASGRVPDFDTMLVSARAQAARAGEEDAVTLRDASTTVRGASVTSIAGSGAQRRRAARVGGWASLATAAVAAGLLLVAGPGDSADAEFERLISSYSTDRASGGWTSPTASLLDTPGVDLGAVPSIGGVLRGMRTDTTDPEGRDS
jgi:hypothetical protein